MIGGEYVCFFGGGEVATVVNNDDEASRPEGDEPVE